MDTTDRAGATLARQQETLGSLLGGDTQDFQPMRSIVVRSLPKSNTPESQRCPQEATVSQIEQPRPALSEATRRGIAWRKNWAAMAHRVGSKSRAMMAKATFLAIREETAGYECCCWPSVIEENSELSREEIYRALEDLNDWGLIELDASARGMYVDSVVLPGEEEDEFLCIQSGGVQ
jgi:hypothetical protein